MHIREAAFEAVVVVAEAFVIEAEQVEDGGVKVVNARDIDGGLPAELIGLAVVLGTGLHASSGEDAGEATGVVIATGRTFLESGHAAKLGAENEERVGEQAALFQIHEERSSGLVEHFGMAGILRGDGLVAVPIAHALAHGIRAVEDLDEAHSLLAQATREDAIFGVTGLHGVRGIVRAIHFQNVRGLAAEIGERGHGHLHLRGEFVAGDASNEFAIAGEFFEMTLVESLQEIRGGFVGARGDAIGPREEADGVFRVEGGALIRGGEEGGAPVVARSLRIATRIGNGDVGRQVFVFGAKRVVHPGARGRKALQRLAGGHEGLAGAMRVRLRRHAVAEKEVVHAATELRQ